MCSTKHFARANHIENGIIWRDKLYIVGDDDCGLFVSPVAQCLDHARSVHFVKCGCWFIQQ